MRWGFFNEVVSILQKDLFLHHPGALACNDGYTEHFLFQSILLTRLDHQRAVSLPLVGPFQDEEAVDDHVSGCVDPTPGVFTGQVFY